MKKIVIACLGFACMFGFSTDANAFWWKSNSVKCKATNTFSIGYAGVELQFEESWEGTKTVCKSGDGWCWSSSCS